MKQKNSPRFIPVGTMLLLFGAALCPAQQSLSWEQVKLRFESANPELKADALNVDETQAQEITAYLRPNPQFSAAADGTQLVPHDGVWQPLAGTDFVGTLSYLHERDRKRELRLESAKEATRIARSQHEDLIRTLEFNLRNAFVNTLEAKALLDLAKDEMRVLRPHHRYQQGEVQGR